MKGILRCVTVAAFLLSASSALAAGDAAHAVQALYERYVKAEKGGAGPDQLDSRLYTPRVGKLIASLKKACKGKEICLPDADFLIGGQDFKISGLKVRAVSDGGEAARIEATFKNFDTRLRRVFTMRKSDDRWLIDDIEFGEGGRLAEQLKPNP